MYGWTWPEKPVSVGTTTSTSFAVRRVWTDVVSSSALTTDMSTVTPGLAASNFLLNSSMNVTSGGFWWIRTRTVPDTAAPPPGCDAPGAPVGAVVVPPPHAATIRAAATTSNLRMAFLSLLHSAAG